MGGIIASTGGTATESCLEIRTVMIQSSTWVVQPLPTDSTTVKILGKVFPILFYSRLIPLIDPFLGQSNELNPNPNSNLPLALDRGLVESRLSSTIR
ncbi:hypothetical protein GW17_00022611 [Ensete ventricosum]|nr:hypothetical protein GW17_00022611 [Ensete ventricosum]